MKSFKSFLREQIELLTEAKIDDFVNRHLKHFKDHPLVQSNREESIERIKDAFNSNPGNSSDEAKFTTRGYLDGTYRPGSEDYLMPNMTIKRWRGAKKSGQVEGDIGDFSHAQVLDMLPKRESTINTPLTGMDKFKLGTIEHPEFGTLTVHRIHKDMVKTPEEYKELSKKIKAHTPSECTWCVNNKPDLLEHYSYGHGMFLYSNKSGEIVRAHGFADRGIVDHDNAVIGADETAHIQHQTSKLLSGDDKERYDFFGGRNKKMSLDKQMRMYDEFGENRAQAHFADPKIDTHPDIISKMLLSSDHKIYRAAIQHPNATAAHIDRALGDKNYDIRRAAIQNPNATAAHIDRALGDKNVDVRWSAIQHPNATAAHIDRALGDKDLNVRGKAIEHPNVTAAHIDRALRDKDSIISRYIGYNGILGTTSISKANIRATAIQHPNATAAHIDRALGDEDADVREAAIRHPNATAAHIDRALGDKEFSVRRVAIEKPNITAAHIDRALGGEDLHLRRAAIQHPNATAAHIDRALGDEDIYVRKSAIEHPNATAAHIDRALGDKEISVRRVAIAKPNATAAHIDRALGDEDIYLRLDAIEKPNITAAHIDRALGDKAPAVRRVAIAKPNATAAHIDRALGDEDIYVSKTAATIKRKMEILQYRKDAGLEDAGML